mmetsp:Transcript_28971/g.96463  ORF Transcript_28971/g.96463 Transcript_28971/m.96463 type:complete len:477 (+) Transcript_28971:124-1554(+)
MVAASAAAHTDIEAAWLPDVAAGIPLALARAAAEGALPEVCAGAGLGNDVDEEALLRKPVGLFYDLGAWEANLMECKTAFGEGFLHAAALKSNGLGPMLRRAHALGFGAECASIGEVIYDSPAKTAAEIRYALERGLHLNIDNFQELEVVAEVRAAVPSSASTLGLRLNPLAGAGEIAALSVSVADSKFGIPIDQKPQILQAFRKYSWLNCVHVHVGSGGMGEKVLVAGVKKAVEFALEVNKFLGRDQVNVFDMGGGMPVNYGSDAWHTEKVPSFHKYAAALRRDVPALFPGSVGCPFKRVVTEFGQSLNAKSGWLASRIEYTKPLPNDEGQKITIHFGADTCMRQCYTKEHTRRLEFFDGTTKRPKQASAERPVGTLHVAGPLCFEGDHLTRDARAPRLSRGDIVVLREAGANTLSLFSRHCSRQVPAVYGYRLNLGSPSEVIDWQLIKPSEDSEAASRHWGWEPDAKRPRSEVQ